MSDAMFQVAYLWGDEIEGTVRTVYYPEGGLPWRWIRIEDEKGYHIDVPTTEPIVAGHVVRIRTTDRQVVGWRTP